MPSSDSPFPRSPRQEHPTLSSLWLQGVRHWDAQSWGRLVHVFGPIVYGWCRASGVREGDAPDLVQDVFVSVAKGIDGFEPQERGSFRSWLATITRNRITDYYRRRGRDGVGVGGTDALRAIEEIPEPVDLDSTVSLGVANERLSRRMLAELESEFEPKTWRAFWETTIEGRPVRAVAEGLELSAASVYQAKSRVLRKLRKKLEDLPS